MRRINNICFFCDNVIDYGALHFKNFEGKVFCEKCFFEKESRNILPYTKVIHTPPYNKKEK